MADSTKGLILRFTTDTQQAQRGLQDFARQGGASLVDFTNKVGQSSDALGDLAKKSSSLRDFTKDILIIGAFAGALDLLGTAARQAQQDIAALVAIASAASAVGVGTTFFQAYTQQAKELGVEASTLTAELAKLNEVSTAKLHTKSDADDKTTVDFAGEEAIKAQVAAKNVSQKALNTFDDADGNEGRYRAILDILDEMDKKGEKIAELDLAEKLLGASFAERLRSGAQSIDDMKAAADKISTSGGINIVPPEQLAAAQQMKKDIDDLNARLAEQTKPVTDLVTGAFQDVDGVLIAIEAAIVSATEEVGKFLAKWLSAGTVINDIKAKIQDVAGALREYAGLEKLPLTAEQRQRDAENAGTYKPAPDPDGGDALFGFRRMRLKAAAERDANRDADQDADQNDDEFGDRPDSINNRRKTDRSNALLPTSSKDSGGDDDQDKIEDFINNLKKEAVAEKAKADTLGLSNQAQREALDLAKAREIASQDDRTLTEAEIAAIKQQSDAYAAAETKINQFAKAQEAAKAQASFLGNEFESAVEKMAIGGGKLRDVMLDVVKAIEQAALKAAILGEGPLAGLFGTAAGGANGEGKGYGGLGGALGLATSAFSGKGGTDAAADATQNAEYGIGGAAGDVGALGSLGKFFSGFFANGGDIPAGGWGVAGEKGAEIISGPGTVTPVGAINKAMASMGGGSTATLTHAPTINMLAAGGVTVDQVQSMLAKSNADFARNIVPIVQNGQRRYG